MSPDNQRSGVCIYFFETTSEAEFPEMEEDSERKTGRGREGEKPEGERETVRVRARARE